MIGGTDRTELVQAVTREVIRRLRIQADPPNPRGNAVPTDGRPPTPTSSPLAALIDHTLLRSDATADQIHTLCQEARRWHFATVCVAPVWVPTSARHLKGSGVEVCTVVGFPLGAVPTAIKADEAARSIALGATEIDMVINVGELKAGRFGETARDIEGVRRAVGSGTTLKVILETALLDDDETRQAARVAVESGADFVKPSTGFGPGGATVSDVRLLAETVGERARVKASGGIRSLSTARAMVAAGASRLGTSSGVAIVIAEREEAASPGAGDTRCLPAT